MTTGDPGAVTQTGFTKLQRSGVIQVEETRCLACRECEVACSLHHEQECNPALSRVQIDFNDYVPGFPSIRVCKQCDYPACLYACAARWDEPALKVDPDTGARYIDPELCRGCGDCARACPLSPDHSVLSFKRVGRKRVYIKCDLCSDRPEGPVCVAICPGSALTYIPAQERRR